MTEREWLDGLKAGDEVAIRRPPHPRVLTRVERVTAAQVVLPDGRRFRKSDGRDVGGDHRNSAWLAPVTPEIRPALYAAGLRARLYRQQWDDVSPAKLEAIAAILDGPEPDAENT